MICFTEPSSLLDLPDFEQHKHVSQVSFRSLGGLIAARPWSPACGVTAPDVEHVQSSSDSLLSCSSIGGRTRWFFREALLGDVEASGSVLDDVARSLSASSSLSAGPCSGPGLQDASASSSSMAVGEERMKRHYNYSPCQR